MNLTQDQTTTPLAVVVVAGRLHTAPEARDTYVAGCADVVALARKAEGCREFAISADPFDETRVNVLEVWDSREAVEQFRGDGVADKQAGQLVDADVVEYDVSALRSLT